MSSVQRSVETASTDSTVGNSAIAGVLGGVVLGALLQITGLVASAPKLFGLGKSAALGWLLMLLSGLVGGVVFGALLRLDAIRSFVDGPREALAAGVGYGVALWVALPVLVMPLWVAAMTAGSRPFPNVDLPSLAGFVVYGAVVGGVSVLLEE